jgi:prevent-host-death family protein
MNTHKKQGFESKPKTLWQLQEAKAMLSEVIKEAQKEAQIITVRGQETAVILSIEAYKKLTIPRQSLCQFIQNSPLRDLELPRRLPEKMRIIDL